MAPTHPSTPSTRGFTIIELLVVVSVIAILAGLLIPAVRMVIDRANLANDTNNLRQVAMAMQGYASDNDNRWPAVYAQADGSLGDRSNADNRASAIASLELLAFSMPTELPNEVFQSKANPVFHPRTAPGDVLGDGTSAWAAAVAADDSTLPFIAYDWSTPGNAGAMRVVLAARGAQLHKGKVPVAHADGHTDSLSVRLDVASAGGSAQTLDLLTGTAAARAETESIVQDATPDNIFDDEGDGDHMDGAGRGSVTRSFTR